MDIKIGKSARACTKCEGVFSHEQEMRSVVRVQDQLFIREDFCTQCWTDEEGSKSYSYWSPTFYDPEVAAQAPPETFSPLRQIFYDAVESEDRDELAVAYLAAQLLRRQKVFRLLKEVDDPEGESNVILFSDRIGNRLIEVKDPSLTYEELESGRCLLMERLNAIENPEDSSDSAAEDEHEALSDADEEETEE